MYIINSPIPGLWCSRHRYKRNTQFAVQHHEIHFTCFGACDQVIFSMHAGKCFIRGGKMWPLRTSVQSDQSLTWLGHRSDELIHYPAGHIHESMFGHPAEVRLFLRSQCTGTVKVNLYTCWQILEQKRGEVWRGESNLREVLYQPHHFCGRITNNHRLIFFGLFSLYARLQCTSYNNWAWDNAHD